MYPPILKMLAKVLLIGLVLVLSVGSMDAPSALAAKKKGGPDPAAQAEAELKKTLDPLTEQLNKLMILVEQRSLLSPKEAGQLIDLKYKLLDVMNQFPQNPLIAKPVYQAGVLFTEREQFNDAYEMFHFLALGFPANSYGAKAKGQIQLLEKRFGANYFAVEAAGPPASDPTTASANAKPAASASVKK